MSKYEKVTRLLSKAAKWSGAGAGPGTIGFMKVTEHNMFLSGVDDVFWYGGVSGFWVIVWLVSYNALVDKDKYGRTTYYQRLSKGDK